MNTLQITSNSSTFNIVIGAYAPGPDPRVHGHRHDLNDMLQGISRRHNGPNFKSKDDAEGALWAAHLARLAGIRS
jgi:hypothetical protein